MFNQSLIFTKRYILISISCLDEMDFTTTFSNGKYIICDSEGIQVIEISKNENSLYKIVHETEVNIVKDMLIIDKIH